MQKTTGNGTFGLYATTVIRVSTERAIRRRFERIRTTVFFFLNTAGNHSQPVRWEKNGHKNILYK